MLFRNLTISSLAAALLIMLAGCEQQGPAERAGERIDEAAETVGDSLEDAGDELRENTQQ